MAKPRKHLPAAPKSKVHAGYSKRHTRAQPAKGDSVPAVIKPPPKPLLPNIHQALDAMARLTRELNKRAGGQVAVSVDPDYAANTWVLTVRGFDPLFDEYAGYPVKYVPSSFIRNPLSKGKQLRGF